MWNSIMEAKHYMTTSTENRAPLQLHLPRGYAGSRDSAASDTPGAEPCAMIPIRSACIARRCTRVFREKAAKNTARLQICLNCNERTAGYAAPVT